MMRNFEEAPLPARGCKEGCACVNDAPICNLHAVGKKEQIVGLPTSPTCTAAFGRKQGEVRPLAQ